MTTVEQKSLRDAARTLWSLLSRESDGYRRLEAALQREANQLTGTPGEIESCADEKIHLVESLQQLHHQRCQLLSSLDIDGEAESAIASFCQRLPANVAQAIQGAWQELLESAERCRDANLINGRTIELYSELNHRMLATLRGHSLDATLYSPRGQAATPQQSAGQILGRA